ncbi:hypothetical protein ACQUW5_13805 [Legionella sp. CNM-1927-20]|uniref:hypothetical protein n=1 Tax=Legionella sp. CNM-1927-20 TaxID=3422221 RepID=UPI00403B0CE4
MIEKLEKIWSDTEGDEINKAHAILKEYFHDVHPGSRFSSFLTVNPYRRQAILLFQEKKSCDGGQLDSIEKLLKAALAISYGPSFKQYENFIIDKIEYQNINKNPNNNTDSQLLCW